MSATFFIPPYPAAVVQLLRDRGHMVTIRQQKTGSLRYRIDGGRELRAIDMDRFYSRTYEDFPAGATGVGLGRVTQREQNPSRLSPVEYAEVFCTGHLEP